MFRNWSHPGMIVFIIHILPHRGLLENEIIFDQQCKSIDKLTYLLDVRKIREIQSFKKVAKVSVYAEFFPFVSIDSVMLSKLLKCPYSHLC